MNDWISAKVTLPDEFEFVLVSYTDSKGLRYVPAIGQIKNGKWHLYGKLINDSRIVTHWMSMPLPPH